LGEKLLNALRGGFAERNRTKFPRHSIASKTRTTQTVLGQQQ